MKSSDKYKFVAALNFCFAIGYIALVTIQALAVYPRLQSFYQETNTAVNMNTAYFATAMIVALAILNAFFGFVLISKPTATQEKYFKLGITLIAVSLVLVGIFQGVIINSIISPIYSLSK